MDSEQLEKRSSAITLSDMEIFVFPELMYSLVLANIMSPVIWRWREEECFKRLQGKSPYKKLMRLKQFIMDNYEFNLDLDTWGLTNKDVEMKRFEGIISPEEIAKSNALFGYHGDKYYFDVDIRRHFGLDKYDGDIIPYWKTETVEAMTAFHRKAGYTTGAGECVSLAALYAAAAFIVCGIPFEDIYMILTPLHSQNFFDVQDGVLSNNRRIVTKSMWFNGTALTEKAQRALRNEQVIIVAHSTGYVHCLGASTIETDVYEYFYDRLSKYLSTELNSLILANFLRSNSKYQKYFQFCRHRRGESMFVKAEVLFHYEHGSSLRISEETFNKLLDEVSDEDYTPYKNVERLCCEQFMAYVNYEKIDIRQAEQRQTTVKYLKPFVPEPEVFVDELFSFVHMEPRLPKPGPSGVKTEPIKISVNQSAEQIIEYLESIRSSNVTADLAFYAYRDMSRCEWEPFIKAAIERNPVSIEAVKDKTIEQVYEELGRMDNESIYDGKRLGQPDEVANYQTGDGVEKAILLANVIHSREPEKNIEIDIDDNEVLVKTTAQYRFSSRKGFKKTLTI